MGLVVGTNVLDAFDQLDAVINSRALGEVRRMSADGIAELTQAFSLPS